jgi:hypothetical protein
MSKRVSAFLCLGLACLITLPGAIRAELTDRDEPQISSELKAKVTALSQRIDQLLEAKQRQMGVSPAPLAEDYKYFRRLNVDLMGRIPDLLDMRDFLGDDRPDKRWIWSEKMLAHEKFSDHFANVLRALMISSNNNNFQGNGFTIPFENWLQERLQANVPYNKIVHDLLTSQPVGAPQAFVRRRGGGSAPASPVAFYLSNENKPENLAGSVSRVFLGVKLECAQCHAHPFAKWTRNQFWEFAAFFSGVQNQNVFIDGAQIGRVQPANPQSREILIPGTNKKVKAKFLDGKDPAWKDGVETRKVLADWVTSPDNPFFAKATVDVVWQYFFGVSLLEPILEPNEDSPITHPELLDELAREFVAQKFDLKFLVRAILHTQAYQRTSESISKLSKDDPHLFVRMPVRGMTPEQLWDSLAEATDYQQDNNNQMMVNPGFGQPQSARQQFITSFTSMDKRNETQTSILQALIMMNGKFLAERTRLENNKSLETIARSPRTTAEKIDTLYMLVLSRPPRAEELDRLVRYVDSGGPRGVPERALSDVYWALLNSAEFILNH